MKSLWGVAGVQLAEKLGENYTLVRAEGEQAGWSILLLSGLIT